MLIKPISAYLDGLNALPLEFLRLTLTSLLLFKVKALVFSNRAKSRIGAKPRLVEIERLSCVLIFRSYIGSVYVC